MTSWHDLIYFFVTNCLAFTLNPQSLVGIVHILLAGTCVTPNVVFALHWFK